MAHLARYFREDACFHQSSHQFVRGWIGGADQLLNFGDGQDGVLVQIEARFLNGGETPNIKGRIISKIPPHIKGSL